VRAELGLEREFSAGEVCCGLADCVVSGDDRAVVRRVADMFASLAELGNEKNLVARLCRVPEER
jgi:hypothetical protein